MNKIRVMIVEDSRAVREFLQHIVASDPRLEVVAMVESAEEALRVLGRVCPDVISMDIRLPGMNGFEATQQIMSERPTPIVVVSASVQSEDLNISMNALRAGALSVVEKPVGLTHHDHQRLAQHLCTQLVIMSAVKVIRQRFSRRPPVPRAAVHPAGPPARPASQPFCLLGIVASTGGPNAVAALLNNLPADFPLPIVLVQHMTPSFQEGFVSWLNTACPFPVQEAAHGRLAEPGHVYVAPADHHLLVGPRGLQVDQAAPVCALRPSGTVLFQSMARNVGPQALAVLLTGMGRDGAEGLYAVRQAGGYTIAEDESTAVVYGMPAAAVQLGAACQSLPLDAIAPRIHQLLDRGSDR